MTATNSDSNVGGYNFSKPFLPSDVKNRHQLNSPDRGVMGSVIADCEMFDDEGNPFSLTVTYHYQFTPSGVQIIEYRFVALDDYCMTDFSLNTSLVEEITAHAKKEHNQPVEFLTVMFENH